MLAARTVNRSLSAHTVVLDETDDVGRAADLFRTLRASLTGPPKWFHRFRSKTGGDTQLGLEGGGAHSCDCRFYLAEKRFKAYRYDADDLVA